MKSVKNCEIVWNTLIALVLLNTTHIRSYYLPAPGGYLNSTMIKEPTQNLLQIAGT